MANEDAEIPLDFENAALFVQQAREAHERGDHVTCTAARRLVAIALNLPTDTPRPMRLHTSHLGGRSR